MKKTLIGIMAVGIVAVAVFLWSYWPGIAHPYIPQVGLPPQQTTQQTSQVTQQPANQQTSQQTTQQTQTQQTTQPAKTQQQTTQTVSQPTNSNQQQQYDSQTPIPQAQPYTQDSSWMYIADPAQIPVDTVVAVNDPNNGEYFNIVTFDGQTYDVRYYYGNNELSDQQVQRADLVTELKNIASKTPSDFTQTVSGNITQPGNRLSIRLGILGTDGQIHEIDGFVDTGAAQTVLPAGFLESIGYIPGQEVEGGGVVPNATVPAWEFTIAFPYAWNGSNWVQLGKGTLQIVGYSQTWPGCGVLLATDVVKGDNLVVGNNGWSMTIPG